MHDPHREDGGRLIEQTVWSESRGREREHSIRCLQPHAVVGDPGRSTDERENVLRGIRVGEKEVMGHAF